MKCEIGSNRVNILDLFPRLTFPSLLVLGLGDFVLAAEPVPVFRIYSIVYLCGVLSYIDWQHAQRIFLLFFMMHFDVT